LVALIVQLSPTRFAAKNKHPRDRISLLPDAFGKMQSDF